MNLDSIPERFFNKIRVSTSGCWEWTASVMKVGLPYGQFRYNGQMGLAHRYIYFNVFKDQDASLNVCHKCDNPMCVNPRHLFLGSQKDNMNDCVSKKRHGMTSKTHCKNGHEFTETNTLITKQNKRQCRECCLLRTSQYNKVNRQKINEYKRMIYHRNKNGITTESCR